VRTPTFDFVGRSRLWAIVSGVLVVFSLGSLLIGGLDLSIDFAGGSEYRLEGVRGDLTSAELREAVEEAGAEDVAAQLQLGGDGQTTGALVRTAALEPGSEGSLAVLAAIDEVAQPEAVQESFRGPTWGQRITRQALQALVVFLVVISLYISFRLEFKMAIAAIVALAHDLVITIGLYAAFGFNLSPATVIALLTILGYSLYDTVVVFDRVKENRHMLGDPGRRTYPELVNSSMNEVVYRSISTSITSLLPVGALLLIGAQLLGATTLQDLALALFLGMAVGIYSSLFVAGPIFAWLKSREPEEAKRIAKARKADAEGRTAEPIVTETEAGSEEERPKVKAKAKAPAAGTPEARAPITTQYVRGEGKRKKRRR
jgi:preprotein translocase subunit SecF